MKWIAVGLVVLLALGAGLLGLLAGSPQGALPVAEAAEESATPAPAPALVTPSAALLAQVPSHLAGYFTWPTDTVMARQSVVGEEAEAAKGASARWIQTVLGPAYVPADLEQRLVAVSDDVADDGGPYDAVRAAWQSEGLQFLVTQTYHALGVVVTPVAGAVASADATAQREYAEGLVERVTSRGSDRLALSAGVTSEAGVTCSKPDIRRRPQPDVWYGLTTWYTDGTSLLLICGKADGTGGRRREPVAKPDWF